MQEGIEADALFFYVRTSARFAAPRVMSCACHAWLQVSKDDATIMRLFS
jgi:hypothetical protein